MISLANTTGFELSIRASGSAPTYTGYGSIPSDNGERGITMSSCDGYEVNLDARNIYGWALEAQETSGGWQHQGRISGRAKDCYGGMWLHNVAEYIRVMDWLAHGCTFGALIESGNVRLNGFGAEYCQIGLKFSGGTNNAHGIASDVMLNHCVYPLVFSGITLGQVVNGFQINGGNAGADQGVVQVNNSRTVQLMNGEMAYADVKLDTVGGSPSLLMIRNVAFRGQVNFTAPAGSTVDAKNNNADGAVVTINGSAWGGNN